MFARGSCCDGIVSEWRYYPKYILEDFHHETGSMDIKR